MHIRIAIACLLLGACSNGPEALREWTPADHAHLPDTMIDPMRVPQLEVPDLSVGELLWMRNCARCHGADARGGRQAAIDFTSAEWQASIDDTAIARTIAGGKAPAMPAFADLLTPEQITELVKQIRKWGQATPPQPL